MDKFDVVVVGGGHAGCEAAAAAARRGARTALVTMAAAQIGAMSCNPAIGGIGKGHLVREIDVFDGLMTRAADEAAIHYRMLNRSKGAAVRGPRVQADRARYRRAIQRMLSAQQRLTIVESDAHALIIGPAGVEGLQLGDGRRLAARAIVLATGTFLNARLHFGLLNRAGGRIGEPAATILGDQLRALALPLGRLKTGTPPRLDGRSIDWAALDLQPSDSEPWTFSPVSHGRAAPQLACAITRTTAATHAIIRASLDRSPLYAGLIEGQGPRYCPSIEDKVVRFGDRDGHQIFLEPEGVDDATVYPNGISTSLPQDVQQAIVASIPGLERARIVQPGYAVEYDHLDPRALDHRLAVRALTGLFCAGQINGTTGYEEAAAQGLVAGLNAAGEALGLPDIRMERHESYLGVMIDDLVLQGVTEPYRMLTARAESRLRLRADNAATRLGAQALASGALGADRRAWLERRATERKAASDALAPLDLRHLPTVEAACGRYPLLAKHDRAILQELLDDHGYAPYVTRQDTEIARNRADAGVRLHQITSYASVPGLSTEMIERLEAVRPATLAEAGRIRGITPAALSAILIAARRMAA